MTKVNVKVFGPLRDILPTGEVNLTLKSPCTGESVLLQLIHEYPAVEAWKGSLRLAVNQEYTDLSHIINENDEVSFIPPVSGG
jgi:molybdopterin converting factor subunit 1